VLALIGAVFARVQTPDAQPPEAAAQSNALRAIVQGATRLPLRPTEIAPTPPRGGWALGMARDLMPGVSR